MRNDFESNYLAHWGITKGGQRKNHKYIERIIQNGRYIYFYTQAQLDAFMRKKNGGGKQTSASQETKKTAGKKQTNVQKSLSTGAARVEKLRQNNFTTSGKTTKEKQQKLESDISKGEEKINEVLNGAKTSESSTSGKKGSGGSSGSSGKSSKGSKGSSSKGSSSKGSSGSKEKASAAKKTAEKEKTAAKKQTDNTPMNLDTLKKIYGVKDEDITTHNKSEAEFEREMLSKYKEGSFGYLMAGGKAYKWTIEGGELVIKDFNTDKAISAKEYLKDVKEFKEFQTNKKKK